MRGCSLARMGELSSTACPLIRFSMTSKPSDGSSIRPADRVYQWIDTPGGLAQVVADLSGEPPVGVDTETDSFHHYREQVCLIQISTPGSDYIIDPLALTDL